MASSKIVTPRLNGVGRKWRTTIACCLLGIGLSANGVAAKQDSRAYSGQAEGLFTRGVRAYKDGAYAQGRSYFDQLLDLAPNQRTTAALFMQGKLLFRIEEYETSRILLKRLQRQYGNSRYVADALLLSGDCYFMEHRYYEASNQYGRLLGIVAPLIVQAAAAERLTGIVKNRLITEQALDNIRLRIGPGRLGEALAFGSARWYHRLGWHQQGNAALQAYKADYAGGMFRSVLPTLAKRAAADGSRVDVIRGKRQRDNTDAPVQSVSVSAGALPSPAVPPTTAVAAGSAPGDGPFLGLLLPTSGPENQRQIGRELLQGIELANEEAGELFEIIVEDTGIDYGTLPIAPSAGETQLKSYRAAKELSQVRKVSAIIGPIFSDATVAAAAVAAADGVPLIAPLAQQRGLDLVGGGIFQLNSTPESQANALAEQVTLNLGLFTFAIIAPLSDYGWSFEREFTRVAQSYGANVVHLDWYVPRETKDFQRIFEGVRKAGFSLMELKSMASEEWWLEEGELPAPDKNSTVGAVEELIYSPELFIDSFDGVVVVVEDFADAKVIAPQLQFHRLQTQLLGNDIWHEPTAIRTMRANERRYLEGAVFVSSFDRRAPSARRFTSAYRRRFGSDPGLAAYGYDAARLVIDGWREGNRSRQALTAWIAGRSDFDGASGNISFGNNRRTNSEFMLMRIDKDGALTAISGSP